MRDSGQRQASPTLDEILDKLQKQMPELRERYGVASLGVFGSHARGEAKPGSDIDTLVEMDGPTFDRYMELKFHLEALLQTPVDVVLVDTVKPRLQPYIEHEVLYAKGLGALP
jgi:predicted nucleotidyltransferase